MCTCSATKKFKKRGKIAEKRGLLKNRKKTRKKTRPRNCNFPRGQIIRTPLLGGSPTIVAGDTGTAETLVHINDFLSEPPPLLLPVIGYVGCSLAAYLCSYACTSPLYNVDIDSQYARSFNSSASPPRRTCYNTKLLVFVRRCLFSRASSLLRVTGNRTGGSGSSTSPSTSSILAWSCGSSDHALHRRSPVEPAPA